MIQLLVVGVVILAVAFVMVAVQYGWEFDAVLSGSMEPEIVFAGEGLKIKAPMWEE